jgi:hypothetical protein
LYPHDEVLDQVLAETKIGETVSWKTHGGYSFPKLSKKLRQILEPYRLVAEKPRGVSSPMADENEILEGGRVTLNRLEQASRTSR